MRNARLALLVLIVGALTLPGIAAEPAAETDPVKLAPEIYKVTLDNDRVRVLEIHLPAGTKTPMHSHPDYLAVTINAGKVRFTQADGTSKEVEFKLGDTFFAKAETHAAENIGNSELHALNIELKQPLGLAGGMMEAMEGAMAAGAQMGQHVMVTPEAMQWGAAPPGLPAGAQMMVLDGNPAKPGPFTLRSKMPAGYTIPPHWHPADEHVTIISGSMSFGQGETLDRDKAKKLSAGGYTMMPARMKHYAFCDEETVLQLHGIGPWGITYVNPADDPRRK
jgi:quercetin dioxygenase-like cupin family protein